MSISEVTTPNDILFQAYTRKSVNLHLTLLAVRLAKVTEERRKEKEEDTGRQGENTQRVKDTCVSDKK